MKKITVNDLLAAAYVALGVTALFPPTTGSERALGFCLIVLSWLFWTEARACDALIKSSRNLLRQTLRLSDIDDQTRAELTKLLDDSEDSK